MDTITLTKTDKGIVVGGKTFDVKDILRAAGARWDPTKAAWVFHGEVDAITEMIRDSIEDCVADVRRRAADAKTHKTWLKTNEGRAFAAAEARRQVAACIGKPGFSWICCTECVIIDATRKHTSCNACAHDGNSFFVNGRLHTGD